MIHNRFINQGNICGWCNENQIEGDSDCCATCEHQFDFSDEFDIDEYDELDYTERLAAGFAQLHASEDASPYQRYWS